MGNNILKKLWLAGLLSLFIGCVSAEYQIANESNEPAWAICQSSLLRDDGLTLDAGEMEIFYIKNTPEEGDTDFWLEGHTTIKDYNGKNGL